MHGIAQWLRTPIRLLVDFRSHQVPGPYLVEWCHRESWTVAISRQGFDTHPEALGFARQVAGIDRVIFDTTPPFLRGAEAVDDTAYLKRAQAHGHMREHGDYAVLAAQASLLMILPASQREARLSALAGTQMKLMRWAISQVQEVRWAPAVEIRPARPAPELDEAFISHPPADAPESLWRRWASQILAEAPRAQALMEQGANRRNAP